MIWQPVIDAVYMGANRYTGYVPKSIKLTLKCGHEQHRKASQGAPLKARCKDCEREASRLSSQDGRGAAE